MRQSVEPGERFGKLTVIGESNRPGGYHRRYVCECDCGRTITARASDLRRRTRSCGCTGGRPRKATE